MSQITVGEALNIPENVLTNLGKAQLAIDKLATSTENFINRIGPDFISVMKRMSDASLSASSEIAADFGSRIPQSISTAIQKMDELARKAGNLKVNTSGLDMSGAASAPTKLRIVIDHSALAADMAAAKKTVIDVLASIPPLKIQVSDEWVNKIKRQITDIQKRLDKLKLPKLDANITVKGAGQSATGAQVGISKDTVKNAEDLNKSLVKITETFTKLGDIVKEATRAISAMFSNPNNNGGLVTSISNLLLRIQQLSTEVATLKSSLQATNVPILPNVTQSGGRATSILQQLSGSFRSVNRQIEGMEKYIQKADDMLLRYGTAADALKTKMQSLALAQAKFRQELAAMNQRQINPNLVINLAQNAVSFNELTASIRRLKSEMNKIDPNSAVWQEYNKLLQQNKKSLNDIKAKMGELRNSQSQVSVLNNAFRNLRHTLLGVFSVMTIKNYLQEMVEVHAQLRLQNTALRAIIQNKDEADRIFAQVQQMALRSPFTILQMTTFTKQLAAYRVESEKLVQTTKMLADVSAGLGVDMGRLILAYGQVKSANYLRATEVRQFTEAGLNIAGELATLYTEVEGKLVSVGDVMNRISKRMVSFEDVEEVFKRITSAGGLFYDMQKKQSDSVWGQMQRIKDAYTIMLDEIGQGNGGIIRWTLETIRELMTEWRKLSVVLATAAAAFGIYKAATLLAALGNTQFAQSCYMAVVNLLKTRNAALVAKLGLTEMTFATKALSGALVTIPAALATWFIITPLISWLADLATKGDAAAEALGRIKQEAWDDSQNAESRYKVLADTVADVTTSLEDRKKALEEINRVYGEYLPSQMREIDGIREMRGAYDEATLAIRQHYMEVEKNNRVEYFKGEYQKNMQAFLKENSDALKYLGLSESEFMDVVEKSIAKSKEVGEKANLAWWQLVESIAGYINRDHVLTNYSLDGSNFDDLYSSFAQIDAAAKTYELTLSGIVDKQQSMVNSFAESLSKQFKIPVGEIKDTFSKTLSEGAKQGFKDSSQYITLFQKRMMDQYGVSPSVSPQMGSMIKLWSDMARGTEEYEFNLENLNQKQRKFFEGLVPQMEAQKKKFDEVIGGVDKLKNAYTVLIDKKSELDEAKSGGDKSKITVATEEYKQAIQEIQEIYKSMGYKAPDTDFVVKQIEKTTGEIATMCEDQGVRAGNLFVDNFIKQFPTLTAAFGSMLEQMNARIKGIKLPDAQQKMRETLDGVEKEYKQKGLFRSIRIDATTTANEVQTQLKNMYQNYADNIDSYTTAIKSGLSETVASLLFLSGMTLSEYKEKKDASLKAAQSFGWTPKEKKSKSKGEKIDWWQKRKDLAKEINSEYEKMLKYYDMQTARAKVLASYSDAIASTFKGTKWAKLENWLGLDKKSTAEMLRNLLSSAKSISKKTKEALLSDIGKLEVEIGIKAQEGELEDFKKLIDHTFTGFELTKELKDMGLTTDLLSNLNAVEVNSPKELRRLLDAWYNDFKERFNLGENLAKAYEQYSKKIDDIEKKEAKARIKNLVKYTKESMSARGKLMLDYYQEQNKILSSREISGDTADLALENLRKKLKTDLQKQDWNDLRNSEWFISMFDDIELATNTSIDNMLKKLTEMKGAWASMDLKEVRTVLDYMRRLNEQKIERDPFGQLKSSLKDVNTLIKDGHTLKSVQSDLQTHSQAVTDLENERTALETVLALRLTEKDLSDESAEAYSKYRDMSLDQIINERDELKKNLSEFSKLTMVKSLRSTESSHLTKDDVELMQQYSEMSDAELNSQIERANSLSIEYDVLCKLVDIRRNNNALSERNVQLKNKYSSKTYAQIQQEIKALDTQIAQGKILTAEDNDRLEKFKSLKTSMDKATESWGKYLDFAKEAKESVMKLLEVFGVEADSVGAQFADAALNIADAVFQAYMLQLMIKALGTEAKAAMGVFGWILIALEAIVSLFTAIFNASEKKKQKQIDALKDSVDKLSRAYDKLKTSIENAYKLDDYKSLESRSERNINARIQNYQRMIELENSKKKTDKDKLKEYREAVEDLQDELQDLRNEQTKALGGFGSDGRLDAAQEFVDVWLDAYQESGDGLDALEDKWDEYIENLLKKQAAYRLVGRRMETFFNMIDQMANAHSELSMKEILERIQAVEGDVLDKANEELKEFFDYFGWSGGDLLLSDLQKGIQNITEEQAAALESITNSIRFGVWRQVDLLSELTETVRSQYGDSSNVMLNEVKGIRRLVESIDNRMSSVIKTSGTPDGRPSIRIA